MNEQTPERIEFSDEDVKNLEAMGVTAGDVPEFHPILEVWREVLKPAHEQATEHITPQWALRTVSQHAGMTFADMPKFQELYFTKLLELMEILDEEIKTDDDCLTYRTPEEDAQHNSQHYRNLLLDWQIRFLDWEMDWDTSSPTAHVEIAAISEIHKLFFGDTGMTQFLDNIQFQFPEQDQAALAEALQAHKEGR
jgi:hypothetical protein